MEGERVFNIQYTTKCHSEGAKRPKNLVWRRFAALSVTSCREVLIPCHPLFKLEQNYAPALLSGSYRIFMLDSGSGVTLLSQCACSLRVKNKKTGALQVRPSPRGLACDNQARAEVPPASAGPSHLKHMRRISNSVVHQNGISKSHPPCVSTSSKSPFGYIFTSKTKYLMLSKGRLRILASARDNTLSS